MDNNQDSVNTTHFGYETVDKQDKANKVAGVFSSVAKKYDIMNDLMSLGIHRIWKKIAIEICGIKVGQSVLDIAAGSGDLTKKFSNLVGEQGCVISSDINNDMLSVGRDRLLDLGLTNNIEFCQANAECLPFADNSFHCAAIGFGLRNVTDIQAALNSMYRVLKPGGRLVILEFSKPTLPGLKPLYDAYSFSILPFLGKIIADDSDSYRYLAESIRMHPDQKTLLDMMNQAGFINTNYFNLSGGIVAIHRGYKS